MKELALIIDDESTSRKIASYFLSLLEFDYREASDGNEAIETLLNDHPAVVILDWRMPILNGYSTLTITEDIMRQIKRSNSINSLSENPIKVVLYTSVKIEEIDIPETHSFKVIGYINKDWEIDIQKRKFGKILKNKSLKGMY